VALWRLNSHIYVHLKHKLQLLNASGKSGNRDTERQLTFKDHMLVNCQVDGSAYLLCEGTP
jgi:hypothetical protein